MVYIINTFMRLRLPLLEKYSFGDASTRLKAVLGTRCTRDHSARTIGNRDPMHEVCTSRHEWSKRKKQTQE